MRIINPVDSFMRNGAWSAMSQLDQIRYLRALKYERQSTRSANVRRALELLDESGQIRIVYSGDLPVDIVIVGERGVDVLNEARDTGGFVDLKNFMLGVDALVDEIVSIEAVLS